jgi:hypothetical protein
LFDCIQSLPSIKLVIRFVATSAIICVVIPLILIVNNVSPMMSTDEQLADK